MFRGREMTHTELGRKILDRLVGDLGEMVTVESMPKQEGRNMIMVISPNKRHLEQLARAQARELEATPELQAEAPPEPIIEPEAAVAPAPAGEPEPVPDPEPAAEAEPVATASETDEG